MSGGMDSTAAALLLQRAGHEVTGFHMRLHDLSDRTWPQGQKAAEEIGVPVEQVDFSREFADLIVRPFLEEYESGKTPSPCPRCNRMIKLALLLEKVRLLGFERIATGHYARISRADEKPELLRGIDHKKDQSYFLAMLTRDMLKRTIFPLGTYTKTAVRDFLRHEGISVWESEESQELCFVPGGDYRAFLVRYGIKSHPGAIIDVQGRVLGRHQGITGYTVGQRRGLGVPGREPYYVIRIEPGTNTIIIGTRDESLADVMRIANINLLRSAPILNGQRFEVKVRSTATPAACMVSASSGDSLELRLDEPQSGIARGQAAALYSGDRVVCGGWIDAAWRELAPGRQRQD